MSRTIALGSIFIECNHFGGPPADLEAFRRSELFYGPEVLSRTGGTVGGMLETLAERGCRVEPLLVASACPSGPVTRECYTQLRDDLLDRLARLGSVDGVLLALHGAAAVEEAHLESDLLPAVRARIGEGTPIVATLDLHAHVTQAMIESADAILAWETYPHRDAFNTGCRGAQALVDILEGSLKPAMALAKVPAIVTALLGYTEGEGPFADVMRLAKSFEERAGVYSTAAFMVHPNLDLADMGSGGLVITRGDAALASDLAGQIARRYWSHRFELEPVVWKPEEAVCRGVSERPGSVVLVEAADCCGGGAAGDSVHALAALLQVAGDQKALVPVVDPAGAKACHEAGVGARLTLKLGHRVDSKWGRPIDVQGTVKRLSDGRFLYQGGIWDRQAGNMGPAALFEAGGVQIALASFPTYEWCSEQFDLLGLDPREARFIVAKNPMNYRMAYGGFSVATYILDTPGPTPPTLRGVTFRNVKRPYFPADKGPEEVSPVVYTSRRA